MLEGSILHELGVAHKGGDAGKRPLNFGVYYKNTLVSLCHALEDCILTCSSEPLVVTAFQRGKWYLAEADRYSELAEHSRRIVLMASPDAGFAEHPTSQRSNVSLVELDPTDPVAQEWHLMILAPTYTAMVLCQELSVADYGANGVPTEDLERKFYGFWTFESRLVRETVDIAIAHIGRYDPELQKQLMARVEDIATEAETADRDDIYTAVSRVMEYLQTGQAHLSQQPEYASASHRHEALDNNLVSNELQAFLRLAQLNRLRLASLLHRLACLQRSDSVLSASSFARYSEDETDAPPSCPIVPGAQILRTMQRLKAIATIITHQSERWDGRGQPAGLAGDNIPLESRILGLVVEFQQHLADLRNADAEPDSEGYFMKALEACQVEQDDRFDPKLVDALALLATGMQQGLSLSTSLPKIAAGIWLLDSHSDEDLLNLIEPSQQITNLVTKQV